MKCLWLLCAWLLLAGCRRADEQSQIATPEGTIITSEIPKSDGAICFTNKHGKPETYACTEESRHYPGPANEFDPTSKEKGQ